MTRSRAQCLKTKNDWRLCTETRDVMDACVEAGEQRRFFLDDQCNRFKRQFQSCVLEYTKRGDADEVCSAHLAKLRACVQTACAERDAKR